MTTLAESTWGTRPRTTDMTTMTMFTGTTFSETYAEFAGVTENTTTNTTIMGDNTNETEEYAYLGDVMESGVTCDSAFCSEPKNPQHEHHLYVTMMLWSVIPPIITVLGCVGNVLTVIVMTRRRSSMSKSSNVSLAHYFIALAISDTLMLISVCLVEWGFYVFGPDVVMASEVVCRIHVFIINTCSTTSSWYLVGLTAFRAIAVMSPHGVAPKCTPRVRLGVLLFLTLTACILHGHNLLAFRPGDDTQHVTVCDDAYRNATNVTVNTDDSHPLADTLLSSPIPFGILIVCNSLLLRKVYASMTFAKEATSSSSSMTSRESRTTSLTVTVVMTSMTFVLLTSPALGFIIYRHIAFPGEKHHKPLNVEQEMVKSICYLLWICNSSVNFYIYCLTGSKFRNQLKAIFRCERL